MSALKHAMSLVDPCDTCPCVDISGQRVDISGQKVLIDVTGLTVVVDISSVVITTDISGQRVIADISGQTIALTTANATGDAFGRLRVSNPFTLFEFNSIFGKGSDSSESQVLIDESLTGAATSTHYPGSAYVEMAVTASGGVVIRQSHEYILYQPGKSKLVYMTGVLHTTDTSVNGIISRIGTFDASMGVFVQYGPNGDISIVERHQSGTETSVPRASWSDPLNGTGPSGISVDFTKAQIFVFDFEWLGVGQVRCGIVIGGILYYYYTFTHVNTLTSPYILTAKLPLRYEIRSTATGSTGKMRMICGTIISEGGFTPFGSHFIFPTGPASRYGFVTPGVNVPYWDTDNPGTETFIPIVSVRPKLTYPARYGTIKIKNVDIFGTDSAKYGCWRLILNGTVTDSSGSTTPTFVPHDSSGSIAEVRFHRHTSSTAINDTFTQNSGKVLYQNFFAGRSNSILFNTTEELLAAPSIVVNNLSGVQDTITLVCNSLSSNSNKIYAHIEWIEIL